MTLKEQIMDDVKSAMRSREKETLVALRSLQAAIKYLEIDKRPDPLSDDDVLSVIKKTAKKHKDSIEQYTNANRMDLVDKEKFELDLLKKYLPTPLDESQIKAFVDEAIKELNASSMKDMGAVIKSTIAKSAGAADGKLVSQIVKEKLQAN